MPDAHDHPSDTADAPLAAPVGRLVGAVLGSIAVCTLFGAAAAWGMDAANIGAAVGGGVAALVGGMIGLLPTAVVGATRPFALAMAQIVGSSTRLVVGAGAAVAVVLVGDFNPVWTLGVLLVCMLVALLAELVIIMPVVGAQRAHPAVQGTHG
ncbi:MAG: hypothetical protein DHS20C14_21090 [Phycisphaeraceae bacterium]|nr:MAG: hypothetical protein DHS20C14_21090 [Phycisphaeraceae bacterium]